MPKLKRLREMIRVILKEEINPYGTGNSAVYDEDEELELVGHT